MSLREIQSAMYEAVTSADLDRSSKLLAPEGSLSPEKRIAVYADMYLFRLVDALRDDFPKVARLCGDRKFFELAMKYARRHPSEDPSLAHFGRHFAKFLRPLDHGPRRRGPAQRSQRSVLREPERFGKCDHCSRARYRNHY